MAIIQLTNAALSPTTKRIYANAVTVGGQVDIDATPNANNEGSLASVHTQTYENLKYTIQGVYFNTANTDELSYTDVLTLYRTAYDGTNASTLTIKYDADDIVLPDMLGATDGISVVLSSLSLSLSTRDVKDAQRPTMSLTFVETL